MAQKHPITVELSTDVLISRLAGGTLDREGAEALAARLVETYRQRLAQPDVVAALAQLLTDMQCIYGPDGGKLTLKLNFDPPPLLECTYSGVKSFRD